ncbi:hypothetical protein HXX76_002079 [Chlamydomonas incerta]|uniref:Ferritin n=1 Tax=Chlamydomonas incerta TaxID=51695 RepID=A0A835WAE0_CHLIN|nr:hypothetical protein HXX76_002079 [Chlamydomonas incerta]|eukprot:KAG2443733.1 hypothetical protein HXX76_002079 [Chlamydomonas incerta]
MLLLSTAVSASAVSGRLACSRGRPQRAAAAPAAAGVRRGALQARRALSDSEGREPAREDPVAARARQQVQSGLVFQPMGEVQPLVAAMDQQLMDPKAEPGLAATYSLARSNYSPDLESAINEQINIELNMSYVYTSMYNFFARDDVGLPGFAAYFRHNSGEERDHAHLLMNYQTQRGGRVRLLALAPPETEFWHAEKGDALHATELALSLEKLNFQKLRDLHSVAQNLGDADATHFIEDYLLHEQSKDVKEAAVLVSQVRRAGRGHGVFHVDSLLTREYGEKGAGGLDGNGAGPLAG